MHLKALILRPLAASVVASLMLTTLAPVAPRAEPGAVKVRAVEATAAVNDTHDFDVSPDATHVAIHWAGHPDAIVTAAFSTDGSTFSEPEAVDVEDSDDGPDGAPTDETYGDLIRVDGIRTVRVHTDQPLAKLTLLALNAAGPQPMPLGIGAEADGGTTLPGIISRRAWGADESLRFDAAGDEQWTREYYPVQKLVVHHTAGRNGDPDPAATVRAIYYYHAVTRRWADIGYNYLIDEAGRVYEGRYARDFWNGAIPSSDNASGLGIAAGHTKYYNQGTLAVSLLGNFDLQPPTAAAHASLVRMLAWAAAKYHIDPTASGQLYVNPVSGVTGTQPNIAGHRDYAATSCPGTYLYAQLPSIRNEVAAAMNTWPGEVFNPQRTLTFATGTYTGRTFSSSGAVTGTQTIALSGPTSATTDQSATVPTQSGVWYSVTTGGWAGYWIQQGAGITLSAAPSPQTRVGYETARPVSVPAGTYAGYRFDTYGNITASKSAALSAGSTIWATEKSTIPNRAGNWYYVTVGALEGYWVLEVAGMSLGAPPPPLPVPIAVYNPPRVLLISPGTYTGRRFSQYGINAGTYTATVTSADSAPTSRYSTLPGQSGNWYYMVDGTFESYWLLESPGLRLAPGPSPSTTDFVFDSTGYFAADQSGATYVPLTPARLLDSRFGNGLAGAFSANTPRTFQVSGRGGVPANAVAVTGNFTVTNQTRAGAAFLGPSPTANPPTSTLNFPLGDNRANGVTLALGAGGTLSATYLAADGSTDFVFDVTGYFVPDASGATYLPLTPARLLDSRFGNGLSGTFVPYSPRTFQVSGRGGVPANAVAVTGNFTVTNQTVAGAAFLGPNPTPNPSTSTLNFPVGDSRANGVTLALGPGGTLSATYLAAGGSTAFVFDVTGYFLPDQSGATYVPLAPARLLDSRFGNGLSDKFTANIPRTFQVGGRGGVPADAVAVTGNFTVTNQTSAGAAFLGPNSTSTPSTSTLNFPMGDNRANGVTLALGSGGTLSGTYIAP
jgi:N-acetylmuramoyl-L-alanine amidase-like protein